jgi:nitrate reductase delta subunit
MFQKTPAALRLTLRALAHLLAYPDAGLRARTPALLDALRLERALPAARLRELEALCGQLCAMEPYEAEARYVDTFDRGRQTSLHLFEHVHGDSRERGPALLDLTRTYAQAGLRFDARELPDHLAVVLEFASTQPPAVAREFLGELAHILNTLFTALASRGSPYASVIAAVIEAAGQRAQAVAIAPEPGLDDSWAEPEAFDGCASRGQNRPRQPQPLYFVRSTRAQTRQGTST